MTIFSAYKYAILVFALLIMFESIMAHPIFKKNDYYFPYKNHAEWWSERKGFIFIGVVGTALGVYIAFY